MVIKVSVFGRVVMLLVAAGLRWSSNLRFGPTQSTTNATFTVASRLKAGRGVRIAGVPVGSKKAAVSTWHHSIDVRHSRSTAATRCTVHACRSGNENLAGDRLLEITSGPGELRKLPPVAPSTFTPSPYWISMRCCWVGYGRC